MSHECAHDLRLAQSFFKLSLCWLCSGWLASLAIATLGVVEDAAAEARQDLETRVSSEVLNAQCGFLIQSPETCK